MSLDKTKRKISRESNSLPPQTEKVHPKISIDVDSEKSPLLPKNNTIGQMLNVPQGNNQIYKP